jgi:chloride channel 7
MVAVFMAEMMLEIQSGVYSSSGLMIFNIGSAELTYYFDELLPFLVIGVIGGLLGAAFTSFNLRVTAMRGKRINKDNRYRVLEVAIITIISSSIQYLLPFAFDCK